MGFTRQRGQHVLGITRVLRFAKYLSAQGDGRVGAKDGRTGQAARFEALQGCIQLKPGHSFHIGRWRFIAQHLFNRLGILVIARKQQFMAHAKLLQQLTATRALGSEVDEINHFLWYG